MQIHSLSHDSYFEDEYSLIGIHTTLEDYKLAYLLNKNLSTNFYKLKKELVIENNQNKAFFSIFNYQNTTYEYDWYLIANSSKTENSTSENQLLLTTETKTYLIPEKKNVDFFIKISGEVEPSFISKTIKKIKTIEQVITSYSIDTDSLKSKDFLIF
ncbi:IPExxxVDY family protein [Polaribacter gangjinensis]|uniref:IPExxxVDY family protein n=1 Tax=Polaribacter gangjinensis TaxID=574710 RepID=A0A2S7WE79_9FLAO|nr:IPExxxVDY family protein [Polaribacter gangjinensis]PQJ75581.1 hypothetical protein BTO13_10225 [Polaribacter gangjinensis]